MTRTITTCERNVQVAPPRVIEVSAGDTVEVFPEERYTNEEIVTRWFQVIGDGDVYFSCGLSGPPPTNAPLCDASMNHGLVSAGNSSESFPHRQRVCVYAIADTTIATVKLIRNDLSK